MKADSPVMLDACVILPMPLADTLLRMAETTRLYRPRWSNDVLGEVARNMMKSFNKTEEQAKRREDALRLHFPEALVEGYEDLIPSMRNDPKDRDLLAACVSSGTRLILTYNHKHFPAETIAPYRIKCQGPSSFLIDLYDLAPRIVARKLAEQAQSINQTTEQLLLRLKVNAPAFVSTFCKAQKINL